MTSNFKVNITNLYSGADENYFSGARKDWVDQLPHNPHARILEIGCANGDTGALVKEQEKCAYYAGIELVKHAATDAEKKLDEVICGDVESMIFPWPEKYFSVLIISEVLEHLVDPARVLSNLFPLLAPNALVFSSSPNVSHYSVINMLLKGQWIVESKGIMDKTHLRWFTPDSYRNMFQNAGFEVTYVGRIGKPGVKSMVINSLTLGKFDYLFWKQIDLKAIKK